MRVRNVITFCNDMHNISLRSREQVIFPIIQITIYVHGHAMLFLTTYLYCSLYNQYTINYKSFLV